ncbi:GNAT family N-acetyltransferase [Paracoccus tibetensis]|uniref:Ribosomal-protein-alanine N-acetyltransferase n=1 Tax=Paracoccus tibetensis TaxID=336292 RepID=A0A1G5IZM7_9RHOB|nr:GNAT family N-acetyltransferase [Paracoccus tibetensis]SCY81364.1 ribosomal-protein-alanine N-acetyltransferase [Paracoccus tibetensis]
MTADPAALAALHARCFTDRPRPWSAAAFADLLRTRGAFLLETQSGFLLGRAIAGEAELLTLAVAPEARRRGIGAALARDFAARANLLDAETAFLEVAADNLAAQALYAKAGWQEAGRRRNYYGPDSDALVMRLPLRRRQEGS